MTPTRLSSIALAALSLGTMGACSDDAPFELSEETEHLRVGMADGRQLCGGDLARLERQLTNVEELLSAKVPGKVDVYLWPNASESGPRDYCPNDDGCFYRETRTIYARESEVTHELVHAVAIPLGDPSRMWSEGVAEALDVRRTFLGWVPPTDNFFREEELDYPSAGHFVRWVWATYGAQAVRDLLTDTREPEAAFEALTGQALAEVEAEYLATAPHSFGVLAACQHPELDQVDDAHWSATLAIDCANEDTLSGVTGLGVFRSFEIEERGELQFNSDASVLLIQRCFDEDILVKPIGDDFEAEGDVPPATASSPEGPVRVIDTEGDGEVLELAPGRYELIVFEEGPRTVEIEVALLDGVP